MQRDDEVQCGILLKHLAFHNLFYILFLVGCSIQYILHSIQYAVTYCSIPNI